MTTTRTQKRRPVVTRTALQLLVSKRRLSMKPNYTDFDSFAQLRTSISSLQVAK
jgi:hypothetical protein